jgi:hypothetical protein
MEIVSNPYADPYKRKNKTMKRARGTKGTRENNVVIVPSAP